MNLNMITVMVLFGEPKTFTSLTSILAPRNDYLTRTACILAGARSQSFWSLRTF